MLSASLCAEAPSLAIDLGRLVSNWRSVSRAYTGRSVGAVVKSDAYGLGLEPIVEQLAIAGCRQFWVATFDEACRARARAPQADIFTLCGMGGALARDYQAYGVTPTLSTLDQLRQAQDHAVQHPQFRVAIQLDTGLNRLGFSAREEAYPRLAALAQGLSIAAWITHLGRFSEPDHPDNLRQFEQFIQCTRRLPRAPRSIATSSGVFCNPQRHLELARVGSALYGVDTTPEHPQPIEPVARLTAPVLRVTDIPAGAQVGYDGQYRATRPTRIATLAIGYAHGLPFTLMNRGAVWFGSQPAPIVGAASMGLLSVDVSEVPADMVQTGRRAEIFGDQQRVEALAVSAGLPTNALLTTTAALCRKHYIAPRSLRSMDHPDSALASST